MAVGYRTILSVGPGDDAVAIVREMVRDWLVPKVTDTKDNAAIVAASRLRFTESFHEEFGPNLAVTNTLVDDGQGRSQQFFRLDETHTNDETWRVNVSATRAETAGHREQTIMVEVDPQKVERDIAVMRAAPPSFVRPLLDRYTLRSGGTRITSKPVVATGDHGAHSVRKSILDSRRRAFVVVASPVPGVPPHTWASALGALTRDAAGVSTAFVLDAAALERLNDLMPDWLTLEPGEVRTFAPGVDTEDESDGLRHRSLSPATFQRHLSLRRDGSLHVDTTFTRVHARRARIQFLEQILPEDLRVMQVLSRQRELEVAREDAAHRATTPVRLRVRPDLTPPQTGRPSPASVVATTPPSQPSPDPSAEPVTSRTARPAVRSEPSVTPAPTVPGEDNLPDWTAGLASLVTELMGDTELNATSVGLLIEHVRASAQQLATAEQQLEDAVRAQQAAEDERDFAKEEVDELGEALREAQQEQIRAVHIASVLQARAQREQAWESLEEAYSASSWDDTPDSVVDLVGLLDGGDEAITPWVVFTGDAATAETVDVRDQSGRFALTFWDQVRTLDAYAHAKRSGFSGGVHAYLKSDTPGHKCPPGQHAPLESDSVQKRRSWADERLLPVPRDVAPAGKIHMWAHFKAPGGGSFAPRMHYYDDTEQTGKVYVGYIGRHLTNTRTASV